MRATGAELGDEVIAIAQIGAAEAGDHRFLLNGFKRHRRVASGFVLNQSYLPSSGQARFLSRFLGSERVGVAAAHAETAIGGGDGRSAAGAGREQQRAVVGAVDFARRLRNGPEAVGTQVIVGARFYGSSLLLFHKSTVEEARLYTGYKSGRHRNICF